MNEETKQYQFEDKGYILAKERTNEILDEVMGKHNGAILDPNIETIEPAVEAIKKEGKLPEIIHKGWKVTVSFVVPQPIMVAKV